MKVSSKLHLRTASSSFAAGILVLALTATAQNLFVADKGSGNIYQYTPGGARSTFASGLYLPFGLAFDTAGDLFVSSIGGNIIEFSATGSQRIVATGLDEPTGLAFNSAGDLFVAQGEYLNGSVIRIARNGTRSVFASGLVGPEYMAFDNAGNLFVQTTGFATGQGSITRITPDGLKSTFARGLDAPASLAFDKAGNLFVSGWSQSASENSRGYIYRFSPDGTQSTFYLGTLGLWGGSAFDGQGNLLVATSLGGGPYDSIYRFAPDGGVTTIAGGLFAPAQMAFQPVPEPSALALFTLGTVLFVRRHGRKARHTFAM